MIFDLDGTLLDSRASILESIYFALEQMNLKDLPVDEPKAVLQDLRVTLIEGAERIGVSLTSEQIENFVSIYREHHSREPENKIKPFEGINDVLAKCGEFFDLSIATTKHSEQAAHILKRLQMDEWFLQIQGTDPGLRYKPEPDILLKVLRATGYPPSKTLYVGDSPHDLLAAKRAELLPVAAAYGYGSRKHLLFEKPWKVLDRISDYSSLVEDFQARLSLN